MRVGFIVDCVSAGGAETTTEYLRRLLDMNNVDVDMITPQSTWGHYDLYVICSYRKHDLEFIKGLDFNKCICFLRDIIPMDWEHELVASMLYEQCTLSIFLSPLHKQLIENKYGLQVDNSFLYIPYFDVTKYSEQKNKKEICWVGSIYRHKGIDNCLLWARERGKKIDIYGNGNDLSIVQIKHSNYANYMGEYKSSDIYGQYKYFIHLPDEPESFGRSVAEATLCGCDCIVEEGGENKIGFYSWNFKNRNDFIEQMENKQKEIIGVIQNVQKAVYA